jgi:cytoskeleton protein RodZ
MGEEPKPLAEVKPEEGRSEAAPPDIREGGEPPIGKLMAAAREKRSLSQADLSREARIPAYYVRMIESDDYALIADQLYLLPFLRRYAAFVGLDPEDVASRFIREVQRADSSAARMSDPIPMVEKRRRPWRGVVFSALIGAALAAIGSFAYHHFSALTDNKGVAPIHASGATTSPAATPSSPAASLARPTTPVNPSSPSAAGHAAPAEPAGATSP